MWKFSCGDSNPRPRCKYESDRWSVVWVRGTSIRLAYNKSDMLDIFRVCNKDNFLVDISGPITTQYVREGCETGGHFREAVIPLAHCRHPDTVMWNDRFMSLLDCYLSNLLRGAWGEKLEQMALIPFGWYNGTTARYHYLPYSKLMQCNGGRDWRPNGSITSRTTSAKMKRHQCELNFPNSFRQHIYFLHIESDRVISRDEAEGATHLDVTVSWMWPWM